MLTLTEVCNLLGVTRPTLGWECLRGHIPPREVAGSRSETFTTVTSFTAKLIMPIL